MIKTLKQIRAVVFGAIALFLYLFGYHQAKEKAENQQIRGENNATKIAKKARDSLSNPATIERLHKNYRR